jgi:hypothetical protein
MQGLETTGTMLIKAMRMRTKMRVILTNASYDGILNGLDFMS